MSETRFTPGPWEVFFDDTEQVQCWAVWTPSATAAWSDNESDANLIAAAPDLYAALEPVVEAANLDGGLTCIWEESWNPDAHFDSFTLTIGEVRAILTALAKARGERPEVTP